MTTLELESLSHSVRDVELGYLTIAPLGGPERVRVVIRDGRFEASEIAVPAGPTRSLRRRG